MDRRSFLRSTTGGTAAILLASLLPSGCGSDYPDATTDGVTLQSLTPKEYAILRAAADTILTGVPVKAKDVAVRIDRELAIAGEPMRKDFKTVLALVQHLTPMGGRVRQFTSLNTQERTKYLVGWSRSRFKLRRGAYYALKGFVSYFAYVDPATRGITRFQGAWPERMKIAAYPVDFGPVA